MLRPGAFLALLLVFGMLASAAASWAQEKPPPGPPAPTPEERELFENPDRLFALVLALHQRGLYARALPLIQAFNARYRTHPEAERAAFMEADARYFLAQGGLAAEFPKAIEAYKAALQRFPQSYLMPRAFLHLGHSYQATNLPAEAAASFRILIEKAPGSPQAPLAQLELGHYFLAQGDYPTAIAEYSRILERFPRSAAEREAFFGVATAHFQAGNPREALRRFEEGERRWPDYMRLRAEVMFSYAETLFQLRQFRRAGGLLLELINVFPQAKFIHRALARMGDLYQEEGRVLEAVKVYAATATAFPGTEGGMVSRIRLADLGADKKAGDLPGWVFDYEAYLDPVRAYDQVVQGAPKHPLAQVALIKKGLLLRKRADFRGALDVFREFLARYPGSDLKNNAHAELAATYFQLIHIYFEQRSFVKVVRTYYEYTQVAPTPEVSELANPYAALLEVGESYLKLGLFNEAAQIFQQVLARPRGLVEAGGEAYLGLVQAHLGLGQLERAGEMAERFFRRFPRHEKLASARALVGELAFRREDYPRSTGLLAEALGGRLPDELRARSAFLLGLGLRQVGRYLDAADAFREAIYVFPRLVEEVAPFSLADALFLRADALFEARRPVSAFLAYQDGVRRFPTSDRVGWAVHRLGVILERMGVEPQQIALARRLAAKPGDPFWRDVADAALRETDWDKEMRPKLAEILKR